MLLFRSLFALLFFAQGILAFVQETAETIQIKRVYNMMVNHLKEAELPVSENRTHSTILGHVLRKEIPIAFLCEYNKAALTVAEVHTSLSHLSEAAPISSSASGSYQWKNYTTSTVLPPEVQARRCADLSGCCSPGQIFKTYKRERRYPVQVYTNEPPLWPPHAGTVVVNEDSYCECVNPADAFLCGCPEPYRAGRRNGQCYCTCSGITRARDRQRCLDTAAGRHRLRRHRLQVRYMDGHIRHENYSDYTALVTTPTETPPADPLQTERRHAFPSCSSGDSFDVINRRCPPIDPPTTSSPHALDTETDGDADFELDATSSSPDDTFTSTEAGVTHRRLERRPTTTQRPVYRRRKGSKKTKKRKQRKKADSQVGAQATENWQDERAGQLQRTPARKLERKLSLLAGSDSTPINRSTANVVGLKVLQAAEMVTGNSSVVTASVESQYGNIWCSAEEDHYPFAIWTTDYGLVYCKVKPHTPG